jgi:hypothetical protein
MDNLRGEKRQLEMEV